MANNTTLSKAKNAKQDEFYTQYADIEKEINAYLDYNPDTFCDKVVLLPCDDPEWSNFTRYFALHFEDLGLRKPEQFEIMGMCENEDLYNLKTRKYTSEVCGTH